MIKNKLDDEVALGSHLKEYSFLEFKGYSKDEKNRLTQNFVPDYFVRPLKKENELSL